MAASSASFLFVLLLIPTLAVQDSQKEFEDYFYSTNGLDLSRSDAASLAASQTSTLNRCSVTVPILKGLRTEMYSSSGIDLSKSELQEQLLPFAYQHVAPQDLSAFYKALYSTSSLDMSKPDAKNFAMGLSLKHASASYLVPLYQTLYKFLSKSDSQRWAVDLTAAGADAETLGSVYNSQRSKGTQVALAEAAAAAVAVNLNGEVRRYAKDGVDYSAKEIQSYYGTNWFKEWLAAPEEKRITSDGKAYYAIEFLSFFGAVGWEAKWKSSMVANQMRIADDNKEYDMKGFKQYYKDQWQEKWFAAPEILVGSAIELPSATKASLAVVV